jgi:hypothetical protein
MSQENDKRFSPSQPMSLLQAALLDRVNQAGGQEVYAQRVGVARKSVTAWVRHSVNPVARLDTREKVTADLALETDEVSVLAGVTVRDACDIILEVQAAEDRLEQDLRKRFLGLANTHGESIPAAAYAIYLTGTQENRLKLVTLLEEGPMPPPMPVDFMNFVLEQLPSPKE